MAIQSLGQAPDAAQYLFGDRSPKSVARVHRLAREKLVPVVKIGRRVYFDFEQLASFKASGGRALDGGWRRERANA
jgi:hypothetical protein